MIRDFILSPCGATLLLLAVGWLAWELMKATETVDEYERQQRTIDRAIEAVEIARGRLNYCRSEWFDFHLAELRIAEEKLDKKIKEVSG